MVRRNLSAELLAALSDTPVVLLHGARQSGKSTLVKWLTSEARPARYLTLDDAAVLAAARDNPTGFLAGLEGPVVLDEVQRAPELFLAMKAEVDRESQPGRFLLTGSANVLLLPRLAESLAGRIQILTLWPFSQGELVGRRENFIDAVFGKTIAGFGDADGSRPGRILLGGYPAIHARPAEARRRAWFGSYVTTILQRDVRDLANIESLTILPRLLALLATRTGTLVNFADLSRSIAIPQTTLKRYWHLLETTFLIQTLPAWSANLGQRLVKSPKLYLVDTGLSGYLLGVDQARLTGDPMLLGPLLENFVVMELRKQLGWSRAQPQMFHFRLQAGQEVDIVLEDPSGNVVGIEVKAAGSAATADFKGLRSLAQLLGRRFRKGIVLYTGRESIPFGANLYALPVSALWRSF